MKLKDLFRTGRHARRRAAILQEQAAELALEEAKKTGEKAEKERERGRRIRMRALRSTRSSSFFADGGRDTIG